MQRDTRSALIKGGNVFSPSNLLSLLSLSLSVSLSMPHLALISCPLLIKPSLLASLVWSGWCGDTGLIRQRVHSPALMTGVKGQPQSRPTLQVVTQGGGGRVGMLPFCTTLTPGQFKPIDTGVGGALRTGSWRT